MSTLGRVVLATAPASPTATPISQTRIDLSWPTVVGATGYRVYRNGVLIETTDGNASIHTGLTAATLYSFRLSTLGREGQEGPQGSAFTATTLPLPDTIAPSVPTIAVSTTSATAQTVTLTVASTDTGGSGLASYSLQRATNSGFTSNLVTTSIATTGFPVSVSGLTPSTTYFYRCRAVDGATNQSAFSATVSATTSAGSALNANWLSRISGPGVNFYHGFETESEVTQFLWTSQYGNDPLRVARPTSINAEWRSGGGPAGMSCMRLTRPAGTTEIGIHWWRMFAPLNGASNGRGVADPAVSGTLTLQSFAPTDGGSETENFPDRGFYGHSSYHTGSVFNGTEYWLQMRIKMDPRRAQAGMPQAGKLTYQTITNNSNVNQEIVTYSGGQHGTNPTQNNHQMYRGFNFQALWDPATGSGGSSTNRQPGTELGACNPAANPNTCWAWSGGWDTVLYHMVPGRDNVDETILQVYAAHEGETTYTRIWDIVFNNRYEAGQPFGYNALICSTYNNNLNCPSEFWHEYAQIIHSHEFIPCPDDSAPSTALAIACAALASGQSATFTPGTLHNMGSPAGASTLERLEWQASFFHDPAHNLVHLMGKSAASQGGNTDWRMRTYDITADTWTNNDFNFNRLGHVYASWDIDPVTGDLYMQPGTSDVRDIWRRPYDTGTWVQVTTQMVGGSSANGPHPLVWHPNLYGSGDGGTVVVTPRSGTDFACFWRKSTNTVQTVALTAEPSTSGQGCYFEAINAAIIGRPMHFRVTPNGATPAVSNLGSSPIQTMGTRSADNHGVMMQHPGDATKLIILEKAGSNRVWESTDGDNWSLAAYTHPFSVAADNPMTFCSLRNSLGCVWGIGAGGSGLLRSVLWRPPV